MQNICRRNERQHIFENVRCDKLGGALQHRRHLRTWFRSQEAEKANQRNGYQHYRTSETSVIRGVVMRLMRIARQYIQLRKFI